MTKIVDTETGELIQGVDSESFRNNTQEPVRVVMKVAPGQLVKPIKPKAFKRNVDFTMVFHASNRELVRNKRLSDDEKSLLFSLLVYLDYDQYVKDEKSMFFNVSRAAELLGWGRNKTGRVLDGLCAKNKRLIGYTRIGREKYYMLNPNFIFRGDTSTLETSIKLFEQAAIDEELVGI